MVSISAIKIIIQNGKKPASRIVNDVVTASQKSNQVPLFENRSLLFVPMFTSLSKKSASSQATTLSFSQKFSSVLEKYNKTKLATAEKRGRTTEILHNWKDAYAVKNSKGIYQNAINELTKPQGALDNYLKIVFPHISEETAKNAKTLLTQYLEKNLDIYSYERIEEILKGFSKQIQKSGKNPVIYVPNEEKSYGIISTMYKKIDPNVKIITGWKNLIDYSNKNPNINIAIFDDCIMSGKSVIDVYNSIRLSCKSIKDIDFFVCTSCEKGIAQIKSAIPEVGIHYDGPLRKPLEESDFFKGLTVVINGKENKIQQNFLKTLLRCQDTTQGFGVGSAVMFPYMAPNNNSIFAAKMIESLFTGPRFAIKNCEKLAVSQGGHLEYPPKWLTNLLN